MGLVSTLNVAPTDFFHLFQYLLSESTSAAGVSERGCLDKVNDAAQQMAFVKSAVGREVVSSPSLICPPRFFVRVKRRSGVTRMGSDLAAKRTGKFQSSHESSAAEEGNCCMGQNVKALALVTILLDMDDRGLFVICKGLQHGWGSESTPYVTKCAWLAKMQIQSHTVWFLHAW